MPSYSKDIPKPLCRACRARASKEVFNRFNASCGYYCARHAQQEIDSLNQKAGYPTMNGREIKPYPLNQLKDA